MGKFFLGLILGILAFPLTVVFYLMLGIAPAAATAPPMPFERYIAGTALQKRISREAPKRELSSFGTQDLVAGAGLYKKNCAMCHGAYQQARHANCKGHVPPGTSIAHSRGHADR